MTVHPFPYPLIMAANAIPSAPPADRTRATATTITTTAVAAPDNQETERPAAPPASTSAPASPAPSSSYTYPFPPPSRTVSSSSAQPQSQGPDMLPPPPPRRSNTEKSMVERFHSLTNIAAIPFNKAANLIGSEGFFPASLEKECNKAARILHSFTQRGAPPPPSSGPVHRTGFQKVNPAASATIPWQILNSCAGLAIFNAIRAGYVGSVAAGSGLVVARRPDGSWSPPSSFVLSSLGVGLTIGVDLFDCVLVLGTPAQLAAFTHPRVGLGGDVSATVGPLGGGAHVDAALSGTARPTFSYIKSRGLYLGVELDGSVMLTRADANAVFYNDRSITAKRILRDEDMIWPEGGRNLLQVLMALDGKGQLSDTFVRELVHGPPEEYLPAYEAQEENPSAGGVRCDVDDTASVATMSSGGTRVGGGNGGGGGGGEEDEEGLLAAKRRVASSGREKEQR